MMSFIRDIASLSFMPVDSTPPIQSHPDGERGPDPGRTRGRGQGRGDRQDSGARPQGTWPFSRRRGRLRRSGCAEEVGRMPWAKAGHFHDFDRYLDQIVDPEPEKIPPVLYHYTRWPAIEKILVGRRIRATAHHGMWKDPAEIKAATPIPKRIGPGLR